MTVVADDDFDKYIRDRSDDKHMTVKALRERYCTITPDFALLECDLCEHFEDKCKKGHRTRTIEMLDGPNEASHVRTKYGGCIDFQKCKTESGSDKMIDAWSAQGVAWK